MNGSRRPIIAWSEAEGDETMFLRPSQMHDSVKGPSAVISPSHKEVHNDRIAWLGSMSGEDGQTR